MSKFSVEVYNITNVINHPNADRLTVYEIGGMSFSVISSKIETDKGFVDRYSVGDKVVYFPVDSLMPDNLIDAFNIRNFMSGPYQNRIKTAVLRGVPSQGFIADWNEIKSFIPNSISSKIKNGEEYDLKELLNVSKYEPEPIEDPNGIMYPLPTNVSTYDIESCERYNKKVNYIIEQGIPVWISEKLEGVNCSFHIDVDGDISVCQRNNSYIEKEGKKFFLWEYLRTHKIDEKLKHLWHTFNGHIDNPLERTSITLRGECIGPGIMKNYYRLNDQSVRFFDICIGNEYLSFDAMVDRFKTIDIYEDQIVPILARKVTLDEWLSGQTIQEKSNGKSMLVDRKREGIVIKPTNECRDLELGRLFLKQRSPDYLAKTDF